MILRALSATTEIAQTSHSLWLGTKVCVAETLKVRGVWSAIYGPSRVYVIASVSMGGSEIGCGNCNVTVEDRLSLGVGVSGLIQDGIDTSGFSYNPIPRVYDDPKNISAKARVFHILALCKVHSFDLKYSPSTALTALGDSTACTESAISA